MTPEGTPIALIVEDNADIREIYVSELTRMGYESVTALLKDDIARAVLEFEFDIALLDSHFPGIPLAELKRLVGKVPVLIMALDDNISGDNVLMKPFQLEDFCKAIRRISKAKAPPSGAADFRIDDLVESKVTPDLGLGKVVAFDGERVQVVFGEEHPNRKPIWCHRSALRKVRIEETGNA